MSTRPPSRGRVLRGEIPSRVISRQGSPMRFRFTASFVQQQPANPAEEAAHDDAWQRVAVLLLRRTPFAIPE